MKKKEFCNIFIRPMYTDLWVPSISKLETLTIPFADLTDVTLADEDVSWNTNSILTDNANRPIQGNVMQPRGQICNICKFRHLKDNFGTNASGTT